MKKAGTMFIKNLRYLCLVGVIALGLMTIFGTGGGGGGGGGGGDEVPFTGGTGTGADGVTIFWQYYSNGAVGVGNSAQQTPGFILAGEKSADFGAQRDVYLVKTDNNGVVEWESVYGDSENEASNCVSLTSDGGYIVAGFKDDSGSRSAYLLKTNNAGITEAGWPKTFPECSLYNDGAYSVCETKDTNGAPDGYLFVGSHENQSLYMVKVDLNGSMLWDQNHFGSNPGQDNGYSVQQTDDDSDGQADDGYIVAGVDGGPTNLVWLLKTYRDGSENWEQTYGPGVAYCVRQTRDGGFILTGATKSYNDTEADLIVVKTNVSGQELWRKTFGGPYNEHDSGWSVTQTLLTDPEQGYVIVGETRSFTSHGSSLDYQKQDLYLIKLDENGNTIWEKVKGKAPDNGELGRSVQTVSDGGYIIAGSAQARACLIKTDRNGDTVNLGDMDFTYTVPATTGTINMTNACEIAGTAITSVLLPRAIGEFALNLFIDTLNGVPVIDLCDNGGDYAWDPTPSIPVSTGIPYELAFTVCINGPVGSDRVTYDGSLSLTVGTLTGDLTSNTYDVNLTLGSINLTVTDNVGDSTMAGGMAFSRISTSGNFAERSFDGGNDLSRTEDSVTANIKEFDINNTLASGGTSFSIGNIGQSSIVDPSYLTGSLEVTVQQSITGADINSPVQGELLVEAQDGSTLMLTVVNGDVSLDIDTNGDGTVDGTLSKSWDELN